MLKDIVQLIVLRPFLKKGLKIGVTPTEGITKQNIIDFMQNYLLFTKIMVVVAKNLFFILKISGFHGNL